MSSRECKQIKCATMLMCESDLFDHHLWLTMSGWTKGILPKGPYLPCVSIYAWQVGPFWQDTIDVCIVIVNHICPRSRVIWYSGQIAIKIVHAWPIFVHSKELFLRFNNVNGPLDILSPSWHHFIMIMFGGCSIDPEFTVDICEYHLEWKFLLLLVVFSSVFHHTIFLWLMGCYVHY